MSHDSICFELLGERAVVISACGVEIDLECQRRIWRVAEMLRALGRCIDLVPGMNNLTAIFDPMCESGAEILALLRQCYRDAEPSAFVAREIRIPVCYGGADGPDLELVAAHCHLTSAEVIEMHSSASYLVYFLGFQPGFAYLGGLPPRLAMPRRAEPRLRVPAGSVGIGGSQTGIYPAASPGGWQLIGRTNLRLFDPAQDPPCLLQPGDIVRFCELRDA